jgi:predicted metalloprotease
MRWEGNRQSGNVEDRRAGGGGLGGFGGRSIGIGTIVIALVGGAVLGVNPLTLLGILTGGPAPAPPANDTMAQFVSTVLADTEDVWKQLFQQGGATYREPKLVLFRGAVGTACGTGQSAMGPFYCPADQKVYLDTDFFQELSDRFGAPGDFAQAYVIAHEVGHHVQTQTGIEGQVRQLQQQDPSRQNELSVKMELQADCLAGVWAQSVYQAGDLEAGDLEEGLGAAAAVGDDRIQASAGVGVNPESWTHGSAEQRSQWFNTGFRSGDPAACDTFGG